MIAWLRERLAWIQDFRDRGIENTRMNERRSNWSEAKCRFARKWVWAHDHSLTLVGLTLTAIGVVIAIVKLFVG
jgi:hypothetical protein